MLHRLGGADDGGIQDVLVRDLPGNVVGLRNETVDRWTLHCLRDPRRPYRIALRPECYLLGMRICRRSSSSSAFSTISWVSRNGLTRTVRINPRATRATAGRSKRPPFN
jgi:hypothetical protein